MECDPSFYISEARRIVRGDNAKTRRTTSEETALQQLRKQSPQANGNTTTFVYCTDRPRSRPASTIGLFPCKRLFRQSEFCEPACCLIYLLTYLLGRQRIFSCGVSDYSRVILLNHNCEKCATTELQCLQGGWASTNPRKKILCTSGTLGC